MDYSRYPCMRREYVDVMHDLYQLVKVMGYISLLPRCMAANVNDGVMYSVNGPAYIQKNYTDADITRAVKRGARSKEHPNTGIISLYVD